MSAHNLKALQVEFARQASVGAVFLDRRSLPSRNALHLFDKMLGVSVLALDEAEVSEFKNDEIRLSGRADVLAIERCHVQVVLSEVGGVLCVVTTLTPPEGWLLHESFPSLSGTQFQVLPLTRPHLILRTHGEDGVDRTVRDALELSADVGIDIVFFELGSMLGNLAKLEMSGRIRIARKVRTDDIDTAETLELRQLTDAEANLELELSCPVKLGLDIPGFKLSDVILIVEGPHVVDWAPHPEMRRSLSAQLEVADQKIEVRGGIASNKRISLHAEPENLSLKSIADLAGFAQGVDFSSMLPEGLGKLSKLRLAEIDVMIDPKTKQLAHIGHGIALKANWKLGGDVTIERLKAYLMVSSVFGHSKTELISGLTLTAELGLGDLRAEASAYFPEFIFRASIPRLPLTQIIEDAAPELGDVLDVLPEIDLRDVELSTQPKTGAFSVRGSSGATWRLPVGIEGLSVRDVTVEINRHPKSGGQKKTGGSVSGLLTGRIALAGAEFEVKYVFPGDFVLRGTIPEISFSEILQELAGVSALRDTPIPEGMLNLMLRDVFIVIAPGRRHFQLAARTDIGNAEILISKTPTGGWGCTLGIAAHGDWRLSSLSPTLKGLDKLELSGLALVLSTASDERPALSLINPSRPAVQINRDELGTAPPAPLGRRLARGVNLFATLGLKDTGADEVLGLEELRVYSAIGPKLSDMVLEASLTGNVPLGSDATMTDVAFRLRPAPANFSITLLGVVEAKIGDDDLKFTGGLEVQPRGASIQATMEGDWTEPFDTKGLTVSDVALDLGMSFSPPVPSVGIAGTILIGNVEGSAAIRFDSINPGRSMLAGSVNRVVVTDVLDTFCTRSVQNSVPADVRQMLQGIGLEDAELYIAPMPTRIGELTFDEGIRFKGKFFAPGFQAMAQLDLDPKAGLSIQGAMTPISIGGIFEITGARGLPGPSLKIDLRRGKPFVFAVQGKVSILETSAEVFVYITTEGFEFEMTAKIYDLFEARVYAKGSRLDDQADFYLLVEMENDLIEYLHREAVEAIRSAADDATKQLTKAQNAIDSAQRQSHSLDTQISNMRKVIKRERKTQQDQLRHAGSKVTQAQRKVDKINGTITSMRTQVRREREHAQRRLRDAQKKVRGAQSEVDKLQREIDSTKRRISTVKGQISRKKRWLDGKKWWDKSWAGPEYAAYATAKSLEITGLYTKIGGIETAKGVAWVGQNHKLLTGDNAVAELWINECLETFSLYG